MIETPEEFINGLLDDIDNAREYIIIDSQTFLYGINNESLVALLKEKQTMGVDVKCVYGKRRFLDGKVIKELTAAGVKVSRFNKYDKLSKHYKNVKNIVSIDGKMAYIYSACRFKQTEKPLSCSNICYKLKGEVVKSLDLDCHLDVHFATQKFYKLETKHYLPSGNVETQYVSSVAGKDFEGILLKAISDAKKRIVIHCNKFIPTPAIKQALLMAILSGIDVKIMLPKEVSGVSYYTSRAYMKEMAMYGATAYIYDGCICSNFVIIDNLTVVGNFSLVNLEIRNNLQNMLIVNDADFSTRMQGYFNELINNSYRICKPKNVLLREKIFKKFN
jgi:cardiolipin synthase